MSLTGEVRDVNWAVSIETLEQETGGYRCRIRVTLSLPEGICEHAFVHSACYPTEQEAAAEGLRAGMLWAGLRQAHAISV